MLTKLQSSLKLTKFSLCGAIQFQKAVKQFEPPADPQ